MSNNMRAGPVEARLRASEREALRDLCGLSNTQLLDLIEQQIEGPDEAFDEELFDAAQALLDERAPILEDHGPEMTFQEFVQRHPEAFGPDAKPAEEATPIEQTPRRRTTRRRGLFRRVAAVLAAAVGLFCLSAVATGTNPFTSVVDAGETLIRAMSLGPSGDLTISAAKAEYNTLDEALEANGASDALVPQWIPNNLHLDSIDVNTVNRADNYAEVYLWAYFIGDTEDLIFKIANTPKDNNTYASEKDPASPASEVTHINGYSYNIITNSGWIEIKWSDKKYDYSLSGNFPKKTLLDIAMSMK